jgi:hypothetical protein
MSRLQETPLACPRHHRPAPLLGLVLFGAIGERAVIALLAVIAVIGAICTMVLIPETAGRALEGINADDDGRLAPAGAAE